MVERIVEFESGYEQDWVKPADDPAGNGFYRNVWHSKVSVDLEWISACQPHWGGDFSAITLAGSSYNFAINCSYESFMEMWRAYRESKR
jgi:hypothetical protein